MKRNSYLTDSSLRLYLAASIITMAAMNLNGMIDGILMGRFLGPDALSAIQTSMPVISAIAAVDLLLTNGAAIIVSKALGRRDFDESNRSISVSFVSNTAAGIMLAVLSQPISEALAKILCKDAALTDYVGQYVRVLLLGSVLLMLQNGMSVIADVSIGPKSVTAGIIVSVIINIICDILYVKILGIDIKGAAMATLSGAVGSIVIFLILFIKNKDRLELKFNFSSAGKMFLDNVLRGIPGMISTVAVMMLTLMCNYFVQKSLGKDGMFVMSIGFNFVSLGNMIAGGIGMAFLAIGGMLCGQKDYTGMKLLYKRGMMISLAAALLFNILAWLIPDRLAMLFGANNDTLVQMTAYALPIICIYVAALNLISPTSVVYQLTDHNNFSMVSSLSVIITALIGFLTVSAFAPPENIWFAFPTAAVIAVLIVLTVSEVIRRRSDQNLGFLSLIPSTEGDVDKLDISVECTQEGINAGINEVREFVDKNCENSIYRNNAVLCVEELFANILHYTKKEKGDYFDVVIITEKDFMRILIKDNGVPFDPVHCAEKDWKNGLKILHHFADELDYSYSFGQNITFINFRNISEEIAVEEITEEQTDNEDISD